MCTQSNDYIICRNDDSAHVTIIVPSWVQFFWTHSLKGASASPLPPPSCEETESVTAWDLRIWCLYSIILFKSPHVTIPIALGPLADSSIILSEGPYANVESHILHCILGMRVELCSGCG